MNTPRIVTVTNRKGGVGKSTLSILLATAFAVDKGKRVLLLDVDVQQTVKETRDYETIGLQQYYQEQGEDSPPPPYEVEVIEPRMLQMYLKAQAPNYDIIFIDMPRITDDSQESATIQNITLCDSVLVPVKPARFDALSTRKFISILKEIKDFKDAHGFPFKFHGVINDCTQHETGELESKSLENFGLEVLSSRIRHSKFFATPSTYFSFSADRTKKAKFEPFFKEFCKTFNL